MRFPLRFLVLSVLIGYPHRGVEAQVQAAPVSVRWNRLVPKFVDEAAASRRAARKAAAAAGDSATLRRIAQTPPPILFRLYTPLSVAQYGAANSAKDNHNISSDVAVASASATVLSEEFTDPSVRASIARELARDIDHAGTGLRVTTSKSLGEDIAHHVLARAPTLNFVGPWNGTIPKGPGMWYSAPGIPPIGITLATAHGWLLDSAAEFRPAPPPVYGSPTWKAALEEVQRVARQRTREQTRIAQKWNDSDPWAPWNETASDAIRRHHMSEVDAARVLALLNIGALDAIIACFDAKYHYWSIRPSQADSTIVLADSVDLPNFPSYPSGHACSAGAFDGTLGHFFPDERPQFKQIAEEQAMSRLYGGIHYRFDNDGGLALGRIVARHDVERERQGALNAWRNAPVARKP